MNTAQVNRLNIGLILLSVLAAFLWPFETFLGAYAVLGPLHYLTEISWLDQHGYFVDKRQNVLWLVAMCLAVLPGAGLVSVLAAISPMLVPAAFVLAFALLPKTGPRSWMLVAAGIGTALWALSAGGVPMAVLVTIAILLPTIIHVFVFTGGFMLAGTLKDKDKRWGLAAFVALLVCAAFLLVFPSLPQAVGEGMRQAYLNFVPMNILLMRFFHPGTSFTYQDAFFSSAGLSVMRFVAFAYLYHYLNWFSKTSVIKWHLVSRPRALLILAGWVGAVGLYAWNYEIGFKALLFLSLLHVILEFPLDIRTFMGLGRGR